MNLETKWLEDFLALAELRNFSRAAQYRNVTQPAFSRRIRSLEHALGVELIDRTTTPLALTPEGRLFHTTARNLLRQMDDGVQQLKGQNGIGPQPLDFAAAHSLSVSLLPELIATMSEGQVLRSRVESIDVDRAVEALQEGRCDFLLAFDIEALLQPPFLSLSLGVTEMRPVCAPDALGQPLFRLNGQSGPIPLLDYSPGAFMGRQVNGLLRKIDNLPRFQPVMESSLTNLLKVMALKGVGIAWLPGYAIVDELASGQLVDFVGLDHREKYWGSIEIKLYRNDVRLHAGAERFWSALGKRCQQGWLLT